MKVLIGAGGFSVSFLLLLVAWSGSGDGSQVTAAGGTIPGRYIVTLSGDALPAPEVSKLGQRYGFQPAVIYNRALRGFVATLSNAQVGALREDPTVQTVEGDRILTAFPQTLSTGVRRIAADENPTTAIDGVDANGGSGLDIDVAVIDTGVDGDHPDLRVKGGFASYAVDSPDGLLCGNTDSWQDQGGHGTHVAGILAARDNDVGVAGVAPGAGIWAVRVLGPQGIGCLSDVIAGVDWVTDRRLEFNDGDGDGDPGIAIAVANMSLGGGDSPSLCSAIAGSVAVGMVYVAAAGNAAADAGSTSPANCNDTITVSAIADFDGDPGGLNDETVSFSNCTEGEDDSFACFSNYGSAVDIAAPGVNILSTVPGDGYGIKSGTSMASPHAAGAAALYIVANDAMPTDAAGVSSVRSGLLASYSVSQDSTCGFIGDPDSYAEPFLHLGSDCPVQPEPSPPPSYTLFVSYSSDRADPVPLQDEVVAGKIYVFTGPDDGADRVMFWLDDPDMSGSARQTENNPPFDFAGGSTSIANPFDSTDEADGQHGVTALLELSDGSSEVVTAAFTIQNNPLAPTSTPTPTPSPSPCPDSDGDGWTDCQEAYIGTDALASCTPNGWPADSRPAPDGNGVVQIDDVSFVADAFGSETTPRAEIASQDGVVTIDDVAAFASRFGQTC